MSQELTIEDDGSSLAQAFVAIEAQLRDARPAAIVLADSSDRALAAAITATKMLIPARAGAGARDASLPNARLIAQLADTYTEER